MRGFSPSQFFVTGTVEVLPLGVPKPRGADAGCKGFSEASARGWQCQRGHTADDTRTNTCFACGILGPRHWNEARPLPSWCFIAPSYVCFTLRRQRNSRWHGFSSFHHGAPGTLSVCDGATSHPAKHKRVTAIACGVPALSSDRHRWQV